MRDPDRTLNTITWLWRFCCCCLYASICLNSIWIILSKSVYAHNNVFNLGSDSSPNTIEIRENVKKNPRNMKLKQQYEGEKKYHWAWSFLFLVFKKKKYFVFKSWYGTLYSSHTSTHFTYLIQSKSIILKCFQNIRYAGVMRTIEIYRKSRTMPRKEIDGEKDEKIYWK